MTAPVVSPMRWPAAGSIRSYGFRRYRRPDGSWHFHQGVDFARPEGSPVFAARAGVVVFAHGGTGPLRGFGGYGRVIVLRHPGGLWTLYAHLLQTPVPPGAVVTEGELIGAVGRTCFTKAEPSRLCAGAHLHFEAASTPYPKRIDSRPGDHGRVDPRTLF